MDKCGQARRRLYPPLTDAHGEAALSELMDAELMPSERLGELLFDRLTRNYIGEGKWSEKMMLFFFFSFPFLKAALLKPPYVISSFWENVTLVFTADKR